MGAYSVSDGVATAFFAAVGIGALAGVCQLAVAEWRSRSLAPVPAARCRTLAGVALAQAGDSEQAVRLLTGAQRALAAGRELGLLPHRQERVLVGPSPLLLIDPGSASVGFRRAASRPGTSLFVAVHGRTVGSP